MSLLKTGAVYCSLVEAFNTNALESWLMNEFGHTPFGCVHTSYFMCVYTGKQFVSVDKTVCRNIAQ